MCQTLVRRGRRLRRVKVQLPQSLFYISSHSSHPIFDSPGRTPCTLPATSTSTATPSSPPRLPRSRWLSTTNSLTLRWRSPLSTPSPKIFSSTYRFSLSLSRLVLTPFGLLLTSRAQDPALAYRAPSYNYHHQYADLDRSARCGLFEDQGNAYATSSSEASPCLATPQTLHPTQAFGRILFLHSSPLFAHPNPIFFRSPSSYLQPTRANAVRGESQQRVLSRRDEARHPSL